MKPDLSDERLNEVRRALEAAVKPTVGAFDEPSMANMPELWERGRRAVAVLSGVIAELSSD